MTTDMHEVHLYCDPESIKLEYLQKHLPDLSINNNCDPSNIPPNTLCYQYPTGKEIEFELIARDIGLIFEWGGGAVVSYIDCYAMGNYLYAANTTELKLSVIDISDPTTPTLVGSLVLANIPLCIIVISNVCYVGCEDAIVAIDIDDPTSPTLIAIASTPGVDWNHISFVGGGIAVSSDSDRVDVWTYEEGEFELLASTGPSFDGCSKASMVGRRIFFVDVTDSEIALLRNYRLGGFRCTSATLPSLKSEIIDVEHIHGHNADFSGEIAAHSVTIAENGFLAVYNYIKLGDMYIYWGSGNPEGVVVASPGSQFNSSNGNIYRKGSGTDENGWVAM